MCGPGPGRRTLRGLGSCVPRLRAAASRGVAVQKSGEGAGLPERAVGRVRDRRGSPIPWGGEALLEERSLLAAEAVAAG
eukprot:8767928-Alexandrium_andersonii.AAC.1